MRGPLFKNVENNSFTFILLSSCDNKIIKRYDLKNAKIKWIDELKEDGNINTYIEGHLEITVYENYIEVIKEENGEDDHIAVIPRERLLSFSGR